MFLADLERNELKPIFRVANGDVIQGFGDNLYPTSTNSSLIVLTRNKIVLLNPATDTLMEFPYSPSLPEYPTIQFFWLEPSGFVIRFDPDYRLSSQSGGKLPSKMKWLRADGSLSKELDLPKLPENKQSFGASHLLGLVLPPAMSFWGLGDLNGVWKILRVFIALLCAGIGWQLGRKNNLSPGEQMGWASFHLLTGIPGILAFLAVQEWPFRENCPSCKKLRSVNRKSCEHCGAPFKIPDKTGTEIFEAWTGQTQR